MRQSPWAGFGDGRSERWHRLAAVTVAYGLTLNEKRPRDKIKDVNKENVEDRLKNELKDGTDDATREWENFTIDFGDPVSFYPSPDSAHNRLATQCPLRDKAYGVDSGGDRGGVSLEPWTTRMIGVFGDASLSDGTAEQAKKHV